MVQDAPSAPRVFASASPAAAIPAVVYCEGQFESPDGKTAHGLVRHSEAYRIVAVIDSHCAGHDSGVLLDGVANGIPIVADLEVAIAVAGAPCRRSSTAWPPPMACSAPPIAIVLLAALRAGLCLVNGHAGVPRRRPGVHRHRRAAITSTIRDVRRPPALKDLRLFSGAIATATCRRIAVLGTDGAIGKRTTATLLVQALNDHGIHAVLVSTGQTGMIQGGRYGMPLDAIPSQFCSGEVEAAVVHAYRSEHPEVIVIEGQGALSHPAYLSSTFILRGAQPQAVILQHAPKRQWRTDFPSVAMPTPHSEIRLIEAFAPTRVIGLTLNHEGMDAAETSAAISLYEAELAIPVTDALTCSPERLVQMVVRAFPELQEEPAALA